MKGMSITGMILGIASLFLTLVFGWWTVLTWVTLPMAIVGLILSVIGGKKMKAAGESAGIATAGLIIGIISVVFNGIFFFACGLCYMCTACGANAIENELEDALNEVSRYY